MLMTQLKERKDLHLWRDRVAISARSGNKIKINDSLLINFCSSDYLGIATDSEVCQAFKEGIDIYGFGSTSSALISGYYKAHQVLEEQFADFLGRESAILFNSGYLANLGLITVLAGRNSTIFSDKLCHASLIDAIKLSAAKHWRYKHNDVAHLQSRLNQFDSANKLIVTESIFSMEGDIAPLQNIVDCVQQTNATLLVDDAHGLGVLGKNGAGICEALALTTKQVPALVSPLGKAFASFGAIVSGSKELITALMQFGRTYIYTTALPPALVHATITALQIIKNAHWRREKLAKLIQFFIKSAQQRNISIRSECAIPIQSIMIKSSAKVLALQKLLYNKGFLVSAIRPPTVPVNTSRIRISLNYEHTENQITDLLDLIAEFYESHTRLL